MIGTPVVVAIGGGLLIVSVLTAYSLFPQFRTLDTAIRVQRAETDAEFARTEPARRFGASAAGR
jgi:hypothetical protein